MKLISERTLVGMIPTWTQVKFSSCIQLLGHCRGNGEYIWQVNYGYQTFYVLRKNTETTILFSLDQMIVFIPISHISKSHTYNSFLICVFPNMDMSFDQELIKIKKMVVSGCFLLLLSI